jgi:hypothetical protein
MGLRRLPILFAALLALPVMAAGQPATPSGKYRVLRMVHLSALVDRLNELGAQGYRLRAFFPDPGRLQGNELKPETGGIAILERTDGPAGGFSYVTFTGKGGETLVSRMNGAAAEGYRLMPRATAASWSLPFGDVMVWMERTPAETRAIEYAVVGVGRKALGRSMVSPAMWFEFNPFEYVHRDLQKAYDRGFVVCYAAGSHIILVRDAPAAPASAPSAAAGASKPWPYRYLKFSKAPELEKKLQLAAGEGFALVDLNPGAFLTTPGLVLVKPASEATAQPSGEVFRVVEKKKLDELEAAINAVGQTGFRLRAESLSMLNPSLCCPQVRLRAVMMKGSGSTANYQYRLREFSDGAALGLLLDELAGEGFYPVALMTPATVILERQEPASAQ